MYPTVIFATAFLILFVGGGARFAIGLTFKPMLAEFHWARGELGLAVGVYLVVSAFATYLAGRLADRVSPRLLLNTGVIISGIGIGLMSVVKQPWQALLIYGLVFAVGSGLASLTPVGVMVTHAFPRRTGICQCRGHLRDKRWAVGNDCAACRSPNRKLDGVPCFILLALAHLALIPLLISTLPSHVHHQPAEVVRVGLSVRDAARTSRFWLLLMIYAICGFDDFFVSTHVVAFAQDRGVEALLAGNLLALMGFTGLIGLVATALISDRIGPMWTAAIAFTARVGVFCLIAVDTSTPSIAIFSLVFGATFLVTAPLTVLFVRDHFGIAHLGALTGVITMVHQIFGGIGAYGGALIFDATGTYQAAFILLLVASTLALILTLLIGYVRQF